MSNVHIKVNKTSSIICLIFSFISLIMSGIIGISLLYKVKNNNKSIFFYSLCNLLYSILNIFIIIGIFFDYFFISFIISNVMFVILLLALCLQLLNLNIKDFNVLL